ncbi:hypothetical protein LTR27_010308 [Elasticomyces elasticus]|nr:hypothetical protein LTR27_010308 [Elasticomyces elasticus]
MHPMEVIGVGFLLLATATSVPTANTPSTCEPIMIETFDTYKGNPPALPLLPNPVPKPAQGLVYSGWNVLEFAKTANIIPESGNHTIGAFVTNNIAKGAGVSLKATGSISAGTAMKPFDLTSFYFACILPDGTTVIARALPCKIRVSSLGVSDEIFTIEKTNLVGQNNMQKATLSPNFMGVEKVTIILETVAGVLPGDGGVFFVDNVEHRDNC